ncbi:unnamed protein product [Rotaria sordida]|uniref:G-protein coupled receptors family 1 profile domain-containing protein n=1 Tax=Rotaria sordida TaxID=392033 RepID=A0A814QWK5_9BILA|nr:unnamed protein product [Rotaria sordida]
MFNAKHVSLLFHKVNTSTFHARIVDSLCDVLVILGFIGNILGLFIFSLCRRTWRISSVYAYLATSSSITNLLCVIRYAFVLNSKLQNILYELVGQKWWACKIYEFSFCFRVISSWITLFWMFERLLCVSTRLRTFFNRWNSFKLKFIIPISIIIIILGCVIAPPVYMFQPGILDNEILMDLKMDINKTYCELNPKASVKWKKYFHEVHFGMNHFTMRCLFSELIPTGAVILFNSYIIYHIIRTWQHLHEINGSQTHNKQSRTASWMTKVLLLHSFLFLASLLSHIVGHFGAVEAHETWWVLLAILINCSLNFYIYCLSGKAFRNEIRRFIQRLKIQVFHILHIEQYQRQQQQQQQRYCQNQNLADDMNNCQVIIQLKSYGLNDLEEQHSN